MTTHTLPSEPKRRPWHIVPAPVALALGLYAVAAMVGPAYDYYSAQNLDADLVSSRNCIDTRAQALGLVNAQAFTASVESGIRQAWTTPDMKHRAERYLPSVTEFAVMTALPTLPATPSAEQFLAHGLGVQRIVKDWRMSYCIRELRVNVYFEEYRDAFVKGPPLLMKPYVWAYGPVKPGKTVRPQNS